MEIHNLDMFISDKGDIDEVRINNNPNSFVFDCITSTSEDEMYKDISDFIKLLLKYENTCKIYLDEQGIVVVEYGHDENRDYWGSSQLMWVTDKETEILNDYRSDIVANVMSQAHDEIDDCIKCSDCIGQCQNL